MNFYHTCAGQVIYKSISSVRSIVRLLQPDQLRRLQHLSVAPVQFQEDISGVDILVHTVGSDIFATKIISDADDYRYASRQGTPPHLEATRLPLEIEERGFQLAAHLDLLFAGIDLRRTAAVNTTASKSILHRHLRSMRAKRDSRSAPR